MAAGDDHTEPFELEPLAIEPMNVRFVHGSAAQPVRTDGTVNLLNISNFVTDKGGATGLSAFPTDMATMPARMRTPMRSRSRSGTPWRAAPPPSSSRR